MIHRVKCFGIVNKAKVDVFLELSCFFDDPVDVGKLISGSSAFSKSSLNIWKVTIHVLLKCGLKNFEHYFGSVWNECNCVVVWVLFGIAFLWNWNENWPFPVLWLLLCAGSQREEFHLWQGHAARALMARLIRPQVFPLEFPEHPPPQKKKNLPAFPLF